MLDLERFFPTFNFCLSTTFLEHYSKQKQQLVLTGGMIAYFVFLLPQQYQSPICREAETQYYKNNYHVSAAEDDTGYVEDNNTKTFDIDRCNKM